MSYGGCRSCGSARAAGLGIAPVVAAAIIKELPAVKNWLFGHSSLYDATAAAVPVYGQHALAGDVCAYLVLRAWSGDQDFCRVAIDHCHEYYLGTTVGQPGPCGAAGAVKDAARAQVQLVDTRNPTVLATARAMLDGTMPPPAPVAAGLGGTMGLGLVFLGGLALVAASRRRKRAAA